MLAAPLLERVLSALDPRGLAAAEAVCSDWRDAVRAAHLWRGFADGEGPLGGDAAAGRCGGGGGEWGGDTWKAAFVERRASARWRAGRVRAAVVLSSHAQAVTAIDADAAGASGAAVTASADGAARLWQLSPPPGREAAVLPHAAPLVAAALAGPGLVVTATAAAAHLWRRAARVRSFPITSPRTNGSLARAVVAGTSLLLACAGRSLHVYDLYSGSLRLLVRPGEAAGGGGGGSGSGGSIAGGGGGCGGGGGWTSALAAYEWDPRGGRWAALVGAAGGAVFAHCVETGRLLWAVHSNCASPIAALQISAAPPRLLFGLDAACQLHAWAVPDEAGAGGGGGGGGAKADRAARVGAGAHLASCRLGAAGIGPPTSLLLPPRGSDCLFAAGWGGVLVVVRAQWQEAGDGGGDGGSGGGGGRRLSLSVCRTCDLSRLHQPRGSGSSGSISASGSGTGSTSASCGGGSGSGGSRTAGAGAGASVPLAAAVGGSGRAKAPPDGGRGGPGPGLAGSQGGVLSLAMLAGGRLLVGFADGTVRVLRFGNPD
ncbi:hypothetical protein Rsub_02287 [Raphidocelis subcapitata]|uniref:F-box domain-containing protein n=1 Tax=Raphidocelis subcapitata TaxID=307507 RepID=A0A2V0NQK6_9CHLO|nr:hypothetical protein Rsub_02287 [Raphidocelis subcapitata]|eukprot:GBF89569.1 hypothetical protein Rsub_02287 [Raphidocelis subcapitata]